MAGFVDKLKDTTLVSSLSSALLSLSSLGMKYNDMVVKQSVAVGATEAMFADAGGVDQDTLNTLKYADIGSRKYITFFDKEYESKRNFLRKFAMNEEIEFIVDTVCDESIVYDDRNFFCYADTSVLGNHLDESKRDKMISAVDDNFKFIYNAFHFNDDITAWQFFKKFIVDGSLAFEIIYNETQDKIIGFKELDTVSLLPETVNTADGIKRFWVQYPDKAKLRRRLADSQVIYLSYTQSGFMSRVSYVERLVRSFNLLRIMENTRVIWNLMNSTYRLKMTVPIGTQSRQKAQESLNELLARYKEDIYLDFDSGELLLNGKPSMQFYKNYLFPVKDGESADIQTLSADGPDLSSTDALSYFQKKLEVASKIPHTRFDREAGGGQFGMSAEGLDREEIRFFKFINRLRSSFQEVLIKPLYIQMALDFPALQNDSIFKSNLSLAFNKDNVFEQLKFMELTQKRLDFCNSMADFTNQGGDKPYFDKEWIVTNFLGLSNDQHKANKQFIDKNKPKEGDADAAASAF